MGCFEFTHRWPQIGPDLLSGDDTLTASAWDRLEDRDREIEDRVGCASTATPAFNVEIGSQALAEGEWTRIPLSGVSASVGGMDVETDSVVIPRDGFYSASFQAVVKHESTARLEDLSPAPDLATIAVGTDNVDIPIQWVDGTATGMLSTGAGSGNPALYEFVVCGFAGSVTATAHVDYYVDNDGTPDDMDITFTVAIQNNGTDVLTASETAPQTLYSSVEVSGTIDVADGDELSVVVRATGDWGDGSSQINIAEGDENPGWFEVTRSDSGTTEICFGCFQVDAVGTVDGILVQATERVDHIGSAVNVSFLAKSTETLQFYAWCPTGVTDLVLSAQSSEAFATAEVEPGAYLHTSGGHTSKASGHFVTAFDVTREWSTPA